MPDIVDADDTEDILKIIPDFDDLSRNKDKLKLTHMKDYLVHIKKFVLRYNRIILVLMGGVAIIFLLFRFVSPFGAVVKYQFNSKNDAGKMSDLEGAQSGSDIATNAKDTLVIPSQVIRKDIVTFNLQLLSKDIEGVWINLRFKGEPREIKMGVRGSTKEKYLYQPLYQNDLEKTQTEEVDDDLRFWQKEHTYASFTEFVAKHPRDKITASYFFNSSDILDFQVNKNIKTGKNNFIASTTLRGTHTMYVQVTKTPLEVTVVKQDSNSYEGADSLDVIVEKSGKQVTKQTIPDDGIVDSGGLKMQSQDATVRIDDAIPGLYKIILKDNSNGADMLLSHVEINQPIVVFTSPIFILGGTPNSIWTDSKKITLLTYHKGGLQTVKLDDEHNLDITEMGKTYTFDLNKDGAKEIHKLMIPKNDLIITGDGYFALSEDSFFIPEPIKTVPLMSLDSLNDADYAIARYTSVKKDGDWNTASIYFDPKDIKVDGDKLYFSLESPGLSKYGGEYSIDNLEVTVKKPGFFEFKSNDNSDTNGEQKQNIITRTWDKMKNWGRGVKDWVVGWIPKRTKEEPTPSPSPVASPTPKPSPTQSPSPKPSVKTISLPIIILNGGAEKGAAASMSATLKEHGFGNVSTGNADNYDYQQATIKYREEDLKIADQLVEILKSEQYSSVTKTAIATTTAEIRVIIGKK